jgi:arsenate reductase-like glutaredoxin family protein
MTAETAAAAILASPTLIKRPLLDAKSQLMVGFKEADYRALLL